MEMAKHWQELLPVDHYLVTSAGMLQDYDRKIITLLYQPLIGPVCVSLYMTLWSEQEENRLWSSPSLHYNLMNTLGVHLNDIYDARIKLEGIGLLNVYKKSDEDSKQFVYELLPPLSPEQFFTDGMLNIYLFKKVGKVQFARLKKFFCDEALAVDDYEKVTKSFTDVFASDHLDSLYVTDEAAAELSKNDSEQYMSRQGGQEPSGFESHFDFDLLLAGIKRSIVPQRAFTDKVKETIAKLSFLYGINALQMQNLVIRSINADDEIDTEELRRAARDWYQIEYNHELPSLVERTQPAKHITQKDEPNTKEEELIRHLETVSPRERLTQLSGGGEPSKADLQVIEGIMLNQNLTPGVINVLIEYVMIKTDMKLTKAYVEKIAGHWARKKIFTVKDAMELAKSENKQYQEWSEAKNTPKRGGRKAIRTEIVPDWMKEEKGKKQAEVVGIPQDNDLEEQKREAEEILRKLKNRG